MKVEAIYEGNKEILVHLSISEEDRFEILRAREAIERLNEILRLKLLPPYPQSEAFVNRIDRISRGPWREGSTAETFYRVGHTLLRYGIPEEEALEILRVLYNALANEFGVYSLSPFSEVKGDREI